MKIVTDDGDDDVDDDDDDDDSGCLKTWNLAWSGCSVYIF
jgi:hypothetical protein